MLSLSQNKYIFTKESGETLQHYSILVETKGNGIGHMNIFKNKLCKNEK